MEYKAKTLNLAPVNNSDLKVHENLLLHVHAHVAVWSNFIWE